MEIYRNVHLIEGMVNCYLIVDPDGLTLIDTGMPGTSKKILDYVSHLGRKPADLKRILLTHSDPDHIGSLAALKASTGARAYASEIEARGIAEGRSTRQPSGGARGMLSGAVGLFFKIQPARIDEILADGQVLPVLGELRVVATEGHTPGHISFFAPDPGILFAGDSMRSVGGRLRGSGAGLTWDQAKADAAVRRQAALGARIVCAGHGPVIMDPQDKFPRV